MMEQLLLDWTKLYTDAYKVRSYGMIDYVKYCMRWGTLKTYVSLTGWHLCHVDDLLMTCIKQKVMNL